MAKKKASIAETLCQVNVKRASAAWLDNLAPEIRDVCVETCNLVIQQNLPHYLVAENLAEYLNGHGIRIGGAAIARWLGKCKKDNARP